MEDNKDKVALNDDLLDQVSGGMWIHGVYYGQVNPNPVDRCSCGTRLESFGCPNPYCPNSPFYNTAPND